MKPPARAARRVSSSLEEQILRERMKPTPRLLTVGCKLSSAGSNRREFRHRTSRRMLSPPHSQSLLRIRRVRRESTAACRLRLRFLPFETRTEPLDDSEKDLHDRRLCGGKDLSRSTFRDRNFLRKIFEHRRREDRSQARESRR